jgi:predicted transcriptional regulator
MSTKIPQNVAKIIKKIVFEAADEADYLAMARTDSGSFLNGLVTRRDVGGEIMQYISRDEVRHYIKDAILNRYSKDKTKEATPDDLKPVVKSTYGIDAEKSHNEVKLSLYRSITPERTSEFVVISEGTVLKWETALKKALLFISAKPFSKTASEVHILLLLFAQHKPVPPSDKKNLEKALKRCGAKPYIYGER